MALALSFLSVPLSRVNTVPQTLLRPLQVQSSGCLVSLLVVRIDEQGIGLQALAHRSRPHVLMTWVMVVKLRRLVVLYRPTSWWAPPNTPRTKPLRTLL